MYKILVFGGTIEGRKLLSYLNNKKVLVYAYVATEYGKDLLEESTNIKIFSKRLNKEEMIELFIKENFSLVIDATHPYATEVTKNIIDACNFVGFKHIRLIRETEEENNKGLKYVSKIEEAINYLENTKGNILVTTGSKELRKFTGLTSYKERVYARVLSTKDVVCECVDLGFEGSHLIAMQGPFSEELNYALLKSINADYLVTKESGKVGGFKEKINAAKRFGAKCIVIGRPKEEDGISFNDVIKLLEEKFNIMQKRKVTVIGVGMGNLDTLTIEGEKALKESDIIIGSTRMLKAVSPFNKVNFNSYKSKEIIDFINNNLEYKNICIVYSGDIGFYSGATSLIRELKNFEIKTICGISSVVYFASKLNMPWQDIKLLSMHGRESNITYEVKHNKKIFSLLGGKDSVRKLCNILNDSGLGDTTIYIGENLSYENEFIEEGLVKDFLERDFKGLNVVLIINNNFSYEKPYIKIEDNNFIKGKVPMTKSEVRSLSIIKLDLDKNSIVYDIGAGTGSISIEIAMNLQDGLVYAVEKDEKAIELIDINKKKFKVNNLEIIKGIAPNILKDMTPPTHVFIGGSSGNLKYIIEDILQKNPFVRVVINAITLETLQEALECIKKYSFKDVDITQVTISKSRQLGGYNLMTGQNPIYIISFKGGGSIV